MRATVRVVNDGVPDFDVLAEGLRRVLDAYLAQQANPPQPKRLRRRGGLYPQPRDLAMVLDTEFPEWPAVAEAAARANGRDLWWLDKAGRPVSAFTVDLEELLDVTGDRRDTATIARRGADYLAGPQVRAWEYVAVDVRVPVISVPLFDGWQLCGVDRVNDASLPIALTALFSEVWAPEQLHSGGFGALRRPKPATALDDTEPGGHDLVWPLLTLNLLNIAPVRAFTAYQVEPGRTVLTRPASTGGYLPAELGQWHQQPVSLLPSRPHQLDSGTVGGLEQFATEIGSLITALSNTDRQVLGRAAKHHLYLAYHQGPQQLELDASHVAFRRCATIEALLAGTDRDTDSIGRKLSQRAAILTGHEDSDRLAIRDLVKLAYGTRSSEVHANGRPKPVDLAQLEKLTCLIIRRWLALAGIHGAKGVAPLLDDALLSASVRDQLLASIAEHETRAGLL